MNRVIPYIDIITLCLPGDARKKAVEAFSSLAYSFFYRRQYRHASELVSRVFSHLSAKQSKDVALASFKSFCIFFSEYRVFASGSRDTVASLAQDVKLQGEENLQTAISSGRPLVAVSIHMGEFYSGFLKLGFLAPKERPVTIIKIPRQSKKEDAAYMNFKATGLNMEVLRLEDKPGIEAFKRLRGGHILFMLCDAPQMISGRTAQVNFLSGNAHFSLGPAELALACNALILPVVVVRDEENSNVLRIEQPIDSLLYKKEGTITNAASQVTQVMADSFESWIRQYPGQWHYWPYLGSIWKADQSL